MGDGPGQLLGALGRGPVLLRNLRNLRSGLSGRTSKWRCPSVKGRAAPQAETGNYPGKGLLASSSALMHASSFFWRAAASLSAFLAAAVSPSCFSFAALAL